MSSVYSCISRISKYTSSSQHSYTGLKCGFHSSSISNSSSTHQKLNAGAIPVVRVTKLSLLFNVIESLSLANSKDQSKVLKFLFTPDWFATDFSMPVSLCEWRVRIGRFVQWVREYEIIEQKEKALKERTRLLKILHERLLKMKGDLEGKEDECETKTNNSSNGETNDQSGSKITNSNNPNKPLRESSRAAQSTVKESNTPAESTTKNTKCKIDPAFILLCFLSFLLLFFFCFLFSLDDFLNLLENCGPLLKWSPTSFSDWIWVISIMSCVSTCIILCFVEKNMEESQGTWLEILHKKTPVGSIVKESRNPTKVKSIPSSSTTKDHENSARSFVRGTQTRTEPAFKVNNGYYKSTQKEKNTAKRFIIREKNATTKSTNNGKNTKSQSPIPNPLTFKEDNTPKKFKTKMNTSPKKPIIKQKNTLKHKIREGNTSKKSAIIENMINRNPTAPNSTIDESSTPKKYTTKKNNARKNNNTPNDGKQNPCATNSTSLKNNDATNKSAIKVDSTSKESTIKDNSTPTQSTIKIKSTPTQSNIKDNRTPTQSTINDNGTSTQSTIKDKDTATGSTIKDKGTPTQSTIKDNNTSTQSNIKDKGTPTQSTIKYNGNPTQSTTRDNGTPTQSTIKVNGTSTQSNIKDKGTLTQSTIKDYCTHSKESTLTTATFATEKAIDLEDSIKKRNAHWNKQLLVRAGDVEMNPGPPKRSIGRLQERELMSLALNVSLEGFNKLCIDAMGFSHAQSGNILLKNQNNVPASVFEILCEWKMKQIDGSDSRRGLVDILRREDLNELANQISEGTYYYQESIPTGDGTQPLTKEQVDRCGEDFKTFYRTQLCKIKTDPLDFSTVLEFERIYTNLVLLRNEMGTTRQTPLDYKNLLTTEVNGKLLKRLMVEGEGGAGKTTFCSKIAWDWTNGADEFKEFDWVLVIPLREIDTDQTIGEIAMTYLSDGNSVQPRQIDDYILANPSKVFIIFDGLDEYDGDLVKQGTDIAKIIRWEKYKECMVLVTTRPWKAHQIKLNFNFVRAYAFIAVTGFDKEHISVYIKKYFSDDAHAGRELIRLIESNDVIKENMAPFPIYIAMLCVLWRDSDSGKRELIRRLKTFSQLFQEIITFLKDHYVSKQFTDLQKEKLTETHENLDIYFTQVGHIAFTGVVDKKLVFDRNDFSACSVAMETCCRVGVLSQENRVVRRRDRHRNVTLPMTSSVFFPHKLFQEYLAGVYLASLFESDQESYKVKIDDLFQRSLEEFRYLLYFTASRSKDVGLDIINRLLNRTYYQDDGMLVDVTFEAYDEEAAKKVGHQTFVQQKSLEISDRMSAHTVSGYLFIMEMKAVETLIVSRRSCGPMVSRDLADIICTSTSLTGLEIYGTTFHEDFFGILEGKIKTSKLKRLSIGRMDTPSEVQSRYLARFVNNLPGLKDLTLRTNNFHDCFYTELASGTGYVEERGNSVCRLVIDHRFCNDILQHDLTVEKLFPKLEELFFATLQSVSPSIIGSLAHSSLKKLSLASNGPIDDDDGYLHELIEDKEQLPSLVGDRRSLEQDFLNSFPWLTDLAFKDLVIGNNRCGTILLSLKQHQHLKDICVIHCYTDEEIDPIASAINMEKIMNVELQHAQGQKYLHCYQMSSGLADALCHRTSVEELILTKKTQFDNAWYTSMNGRTVDSKIEKLTLGRLNLERNDPSSSRDLATFLCLQPALTDLKIDYSFDDYSRVSHVWLHDEFYHEIARVASSSKIQKLTLEGLNLERNDPSSSRDLATFLCLQPGLTNLKITFDSAFDEYGLVSHLWLHDEFYHEIARLASSSKIQKLTLEGLNLERNDPIASHDLATFLCLQPGLTDLKITFHSAFDEYALVSHAWLHDEFYHELARLASSSKIEKLTLERLNLEGNDPSSSRDLATFLCLQPCLTDLKISWSDEYSRVSHVWLHDQFCQELARLASSSKMKKLTLEGLNLERNDPSSSRDLATFLCLQPGLTDLKIDYSFDKYGGVSHAWLHDEFYHEIARLASSSKIEKLTLEGLNLERNDPSSSRDLATFLCLQPCLTDLKISWSDEYSRVSHVWLHDQFYQELARLASSSKIQKLTLEGLNLERNDPSSSRDLATFLCLQPGLTDLKIAFNSAFDEYGLVSHVWLHDEFYHEIARLASSSKNPFFTNNIDWDKWHRSRDLVCKPVLPPSETNNRPDSVQSESGRVQSADRQAPDAQISDQSHQSQSQGPQDAQQGKGMKKISESDLILSKPAVSPPMDAKNLHVSAQAEAQRVQSTARKNGYGTMAQLSWAILPILFSVIIYVIIYMFDK